MADNSTDKTKRFYRLTEVILCILALFLSLQLFNKNAIDLDTSCFYYCEIMFAAMAIADVSKAVYVGTSNKPEMIKHIIYAVFFFSGALVFEAVNSDTFAFEIASAFLLVNLSVGRLYSIKRNHKPLRVFFFIVCMLYILLWALLILIDPENPDETTKLLFILLGFTMLIILLKRIIGVFLSRIRYELILKIAKKSMAGEILSGLVILIFAFSVVFESQEENITSYSDALWYCFALITTIGFGDVTVETDLGRILSAILGIYGIIVVALITSIIVNFYNEIKNEDENAEKPEEIEQTSTDTADAPEPVPVTVQENSEITAEQ